MVLFAFGGMQVSAKSTAKLIVHAEAGKVMLKWFDSGSNEKGIGLLLAQPAHQLMEPLLKENEKVATTFEESLRCWAKGDTTQPDSYLIRRAYHQRVAIRQLLEAIGNADFANKVYSRVGELFPQGYSFSRSYEIFLTPVGWKWGDAMSFSYKINNGLYAPSEDGTPTILFNLTIVAEGYGRTPKERMETFTNVLAHELFHAVYADYCRSNSTPMLSDSIAQYAFDMILNEGLAHYIADGAKIGKERPTNDFLKEQERKVFSTLADSARVIFDPKLPEEIRKNAINSGTYGKYWSKYICMSGLLMAYHVEKELGREALRDCVAVGPIELVRKYYQLQQRDVNLPPLPPEMVKLLGNDTVLSR
jgi:hypothetical protein